MKAKLVNKKLEYFVKPDFILGDTDEYAKLHGYKDFITPEISDSQKLGDLIETDESITYEVLEKTESDYEGEINRRSSLSDLRLNNLQVKELLKMKVEELQEEEQVSYYSIFEEWRIKDYKVDDKFTYNRKLYKVIQAHRSQYDWLPDALPALYKEITPPGVIPIWKQPTGTHDAYNLGDRVYYPNENSPVYESLINGNTWSPTAYPQGWKLV